jgi:hypothetical protein
MTASPGVLLTAPGDLQPLAADLSCACGALREIGTVWRRGRHSRLELPLGVPVRLENAARELAASVQAVAAGGPGQPPDAAVLVAEQLSALRDGIASAQAITCGPGTPGIGDAGLWEQLNAAMDRAGKRLLRLILDRVAITDWSLTGAPGTGMPSPGQPRLLIQLTWPR